MSNEEDEDYAGASQRRVLRLTPMGKIMAHNFVSYDTVSDWRSLTDSSQMCNIMTMEPDADLRSLLEILAGSEE